MSWYSIHHHSRYSSMDGMGTVARHVERAKKLGYPAMALTDHGTMAGVAELYTACRERGIKPLPGIEAYAAYGTRVRKVFHVGLVAVTKQGYLNLVQINNRMMRDFYYKPVLDLTRINELDTRGIVMTSGCFFGVALSAHRADSVAALNVLSVLAEHFDLYLEAQGHGIVDDDHDDAVDQRAVLSWSQSLGLPMVLGQDCHYVLPKERKLHDTMKRLGSWSDEPDSATFPGEHPYCLADEDTARTYFVPEVWEEGLKGMARVLKKADVKIPPLDRFSPVLVQDRTDGARIRALCEADGFLAEREEMFPGRGYRQRYAEELEVIESFGFTGYMLLVTAICRELEARGIRYGVRGSAAGSLVCYLLGITSLDPLEWGLGFDRFLSRNRAKLPDIDIDIDSSRRDEVLAFLREQYVVTAICSYGELSVTDEEGKIKGSAVVKWRTAQDKTGGTKVVDRATYAELSEMCEGGNVINNRGTHASGLVVAPDLQSMRWMPLAVIGSAKSPEDRFVTALDMESTESMGYIKVDILGLKALHAIDVAVKELRRGEWREMPADIDVHEMVVYDDRGVYAMIGAGLTAGVFQLEGWTARNGVQRMRPRNISEIIASMALFRPAAIKSGSTDRYLRARQRRQGDASYDPAAKYHPDIASVVRSTYGEMIYQEQMIDILKNLGFGADDLQSALKAIKASNSKVDAARRTLEDLKLRIASLAAERGWRTADVRWLEEMFAAYADYSFNKAHATAYGVLAYQTAWLAFHYPGQFWQGMITAHGADDQKVADYTAELAARQFSRMPVDVNTSGLDIRVDSARKEIYPALTSIKGVGEVVAQTIARNAPYRDLTDFSTRLSGTRVSGVSSLAEGLRPEECPGIVGVLARAGALRTLD